MLSTTPPYVTPREIGPPFSTISVCVDLPMLDRRAGLPSRLPGETAIELMKRQLAAATKG